MTSRQGIFFRQGNTIERKPTAPRVGDSIKTTSHFRKSRDNLNSLLQNRTQLGVGKAVLGEQKEQEIICMRGDAGLDAEQ